MKIALIENKSSELFHSRLRYAAFLQNEGHEVVIIIPDEEYHHQIVSAGFSVISMGFDVRKRDAATVWNYLRGLRRILKRERFDVVHFYRLQPNLLGTPTSFFTHKDSKIINHITGLGIAFAKDSWKYRLYRKITKTGYQINERLFKARLILQNEDDKRELGNRKTYRVVKGSAVNEDRFYPSVEVPDSLRKELETDRRIPADSRTLLFVSRLVRIKGLKYLIDAVTQYNDSACQKINLLIVGWIDSRNPDSFSREEVGRWSEKEGIYFLGKREDIPQLLAYSDIAILPTFYREGTPRYMLEAMAMGKPIITTKMPGCDHLIPQGRNGRLIEPRSSSAILDAIRWMENKDLKKMGLEGLALYRKEFSEEVVYHQLLDLYAEKKGDTGSL